MQVNPISMVSPRVAAPVINKNNNKFNTMSMPVHRELSEYPKGYMPYGINFAGGEYSKLPGIKLLKTVKDLPCLYCSEKMVQAKVIESLSPENSRVVRTLGEFAETLQKKAKNFAGVKVVDTIMEAAKKNPLANAADYVETLNMGKAIVPEEISKLATRQMTAVEYAKKAMATVGEYEHGLMPAEKEVFRMMKAVYESKPDQTIPEVMLALRESKLKNFETSQTKILDEISEMAKQTLSKQTCDKVLAEVEKSKNILLDGNPQFPFKRKKFIGALTHINLSKADVGGMKKILAKTDSIPTSGVDANAFIAKYSNQNIPSHNGFVTRSDSEIIQRILEQSVQSVEHIRPQATFKHGKGYSGPKDVIQNLALAHKKCNSDRGCMTLEQYMRMNPKAKQSIQNHVDFLIKEIKAGRLKGLENYPAQLQETFAKETDGRLMVDLSEIKEYIEKFMAAKA